jgi:hypothetical protein
MSLELLHKDWMGSSEYHWIVKGEGDFGWMECEGEDPERRDQKRVWYAVPCERDAQWNDGVIYCSPGHDSHFEELNALHLTRYDGSGDA